MSEIFTAYKVGDRVRVQLRDGSEAEGEVFGNVDGTLIVIYGEDRRTAHFRYTEVTLLEPASHSPLEYR